MTAEERKTEALTWAKNIMGKILDVYVDRDFVEIVGKEGGDTLTFRYYSKDKIYER